MILIFGTPTSNKVHFSCTSVCRNQEHNMQRKQRLFRVTGVQPTLYFNELSFFTPSSERERKLFPQLKISRAIQRTSSAGLSTCAPVFMFLNERIEL